MATTGVISVLQDGYDGGTYEFGAADLFSGQDGSGSYIAGFRFTMGAGTALDNATVTSAPFIINITDVVGTPVVRARCEAAQDPSSIAARTPAGWALTTALVNLPGAPGTGLETLDLTAVIQELIDTNNYQGGAVCVALQENGAATNYIAIEGLSNAGTDEATLEIVYTAAGGGSQAMLATLETGWTLDGIASVEFPMFGDLPTNIFIADGSASTPGAATQLMDGFLLWSMEASDGPNLNIYVEGFSDLTWSAQMEGVTGSFLSTFIEGFLTWSAEATNTVTEQITTISGEVTWGAEALVSNIILGIQGVLEWGARVEASVSNVITSAADAVLQGGSTFVEEGIEYVKAGVEFIRKGVDFIRK